MEVGTIVRIIKQPHNQVASLVGEVGFIEKFRDDAPGLCDFQGFSLEGRRTGWGTVPVACLRAETDPAWVIALTKLQAEDKRYETEILARSEKYNTAVKHLAGEHGISEDAVRGIYETIRRTMAV